MIAGPSTAQRLLLAVVALAVISFAVWYGPWKQPSEELTETPSRTLSKNCRFEPPGRLQLKRVANDPAVEAQLPEPCPLTTVEYRYGSLMTNVLVERSDDGSASRGVVVGRRHASGQHRRRGELIPQPRHQGRRRGGRRHQSSATPRQNVQRKRARPKSRSPAGRAPIFPYRRVRHGLRGVADKNWEDTNSGYSIQFDWNFSAGQPNSPRRPLCAVHQGGRFFRRQDQTAAASVARTSAMPRSIRI